MNDGDGPYCDDPACDCHDSCWCEAEAEEVGGVLYCCGCGLTPPMCECLEDFE